MSEKELVKFGLNNVHVAILDEDTGTYGKPFAIPGGVSLTAEAKGEMKKFYADNREYYTTNSNNGYEGELELALVPQVFEEQILAKVKDQKGVLIEMGEQKTVYFAMLFEVNTDKKARRQVFYRCTASRNSLDAKTIEESKEPQTDKLSFSATKKTFDNKTIVKATTTEESDKVAYDSWYKEVYLPTFSSK